mmetsp:Transcript_320/g.794  ORF Transcript_320/g.794 Transcript_320/m.794 type:complete len:102 (+) Transcript_320:3-308(+)
MNVSFILNKNSLEGPALALTGISFLNYACEALMVNELSGTAITIKPQGMNVSLPTTGKVILDQIGMDESRFGLDVTVLCVWLFTCVVLSYAVLKWCVKEKR